MHNRRPIPCSPASPVPEVMPEKRGATGIGPGNGSAAPSACLYCSFRELKKDISYSDVNQPLRLYIDRKQNFQAAAQRLHLSVTQEVAIQIYPDDFVGKIIVLGIHGSNISENNAKEFYGNFKSNANEAIQSAYDEAIIFLVNKKVVIIDDFSRSDFETARAYLFFQSEKSYVF